MQSFEFIFDGLYYFELPYLRASELAELAGALVILAPVLGSAELDRSVAQLGRAAERAEAEIAALAGDYDREAEQREVEFEEAVDRVARKIHQGLALWQLYTVKHFQAGLEKDEKLWAEQPRNLEKAGRAAIIFKSLFGEQGIDYFRIGTLQRVQAVSAMLRTLADDELDPPARDLIWGEPKFDFAEKSLVFETKVAEHRRAHPDEFILGDQRVALRWAVLAYDHQIKLMTDRWSTESCERSNECLEPLNEVCRVARRKLYARFQEQRRLWEAEDANGEPTSAESSDAESESGA